MIVPSAQAGAISRDKVTQARALLEDFAPYYRERRTKTGQRKLKNASSRILVLPFDPKPGERLTIRGQGGALSSAVVVDTVRHEWLGDFTFDDARAEGYATSGALIDAWVRQHDKDWVARYASDTAAWVRTEQEAAHPEVDPRIVTRFLARWASKRVVIFTFTRDPLESARLLGKPGADYVSNPARALTEGPDQLVGEAVTEDEQKAITSHAGVTTQHWQALEEGHRERDLQLLALEDRIVAARRLARQHNVDIEREMWLVDRLRQQGRTDQAVVHKLRAAERKVYRNAA